MKLLTVCIPCYNSIMEMHKAINSCLLMKDEVEVLIVDRHSHDETLQVAREYEEAYPDTVKVITTKEDVPFLKTALKYSEGLYFKILQCFDYLDQPSLVSVVETIRDFIRIQANLDVLLTDYKYVVPQEKEKRVSNIGGIPVVANLTGVIDWVRCESLDEVFINVPYRYEKSIDRIAEEIESMGVTVHINLPALEQYIDNSEFDNVELTVAAGYPTATLTAAPPLSFSEALLKRTVDIIGGLIGSIISLPIILITAIPLLIESPGPLIFKQQRVGKNGRIFNIYKLRSMYTDAEKRKAELMASNKMNGFMFKMDNDPRITKVGKFIRKTSIDELPQFWNVLKGDMSLVGTRPPTIDEFDKYESHHKRRLSMRPGITGMWQVSGRSDIQNFEEVVQLDCEYIDNWSPLLDIKILFKTVWVVLKGSGAE